MRWWTSFSTGGCRLARSTLLREVNAGDFAKAAAQFPCVGTCGRMVLPGLVERRKATQAMFLAIRRGDARDYYGIVAALTGALWSEYTVGPGECSCTISTSPSIPLRSMLGIWTRACGARTLARSRSDSTRKAIVYVRLLSAVFHAQDLLRCLAAFDALSNLQRQPPVARRHMSGMDPGDARQHGAGNTGMPQLSCAAAASVVVPRTPRPCATPAAPAR